MGFEYLHEIALSANPFCFDIAISISDIFRHAQSTNLIITVSLSNIDPPSAECLSDTHLVAYPEQTMNITFNILDENTLKSANVILNLSGYTVNIQETASNCWLALISIPYSTLSQYLEQNKRKIVVTINITAEDIALNKMETTYSISIFIKSEINPPEISLEELSNNSHINVSFNQNVSLSIIVQDDSAIKNVSVELNISESEYTINTNKINDTYWKISIMIPWSTIQSYAESDKPVTIRIHVCSYDINENLKQAEFIIHLNAQIITTSTTTTTTTP